MASRCFRFVKNISKISACSVSSNQNIIFSCNTPRHIHDVPQPKLLEFKTERNLTYLEDPDTFGTLSPRTSQKDFIEDEGDIREEEFLNNLPLKSQKLTIKQYADIIKQYLKYKRIKEAIDILEIRMLKQDRVKPENYIYNILIGACAEVGFTKKAFKLFNDMKKRGLKPTGDTYTCLFEACINSPYKENGLKYAIHLRNLMMEKGIEPNLTNYNVMIKAFGRCGDLHTAFKIVDEMKSKKIKIRVHTLNHLLHACISDKNSGLRHALVVWRKMLYLREKPNIYSFNLMLKCVKECNLGTKEDIQQLISVLEGNIPKISSQYNNPLEIKSTNHLLIDDSCSLPVEKLSTPLEASNIINNNEIEMDSVTNGMVKDDRSTDLTFVDKQRLPKKSNLTVPNLLSRNLNLNDVCGLQEVHSAQDKFAIVGGQEDFLNQMESYSVKPDIKTFTQMLSLIDDNIDAELKLLDTMKSMNIKKDIEFYNMLIKKRCLRLDYNSAFDVKEMIENEEKLYDKHPFNKKKYKLKFNIMTYGTLAMACHTRELAEKLLNEMKEKHLKVNITILGTLLRHGTANMKFGYILYIMDIVKEENLKVNKIFIKHLESYVEKCENIINMKGEEMKDSKFLLAYNRFKSKYCNWLKEVNIQEALQVDDPWKQFTESYPKPIQKENIEIVEPKKFYKRNRKFIPYVPKI